MVRRKRKTVGEIRARQARETRDETIAEVCQVLKWHLGYTMIAETLFELFNSGERLKRGPFYDRPEWVVVPPHEVEAANGHLIVPPLTEVTGEA